LFSAKSQIDGGFFQPYPASQQESDPDPRGGKAAMRPALENSIQRQ